MEKTIGQVMQSLTFPPNLQEVSKPITYDNVELTDEELQQVIMAAKEKKAAQLEEKRKVQLRDYMQKFYSGPWETETFADYIRSRMATMGFVSDASNRNYVNALTFYFNRDKRFEDFDLNGLGIKMDLNKGLFLFGTVGVGKTKIMGLFYKNKRCCYKMISCRKVVSEYIKHGHDVIEPMSHPVYPIKNIDNFYQEREGICFDDLGTESDTANNYGNKRNVFEQILLDRYDNGLPFHETHITSNLSPEMIKERYGERVVSRMREMFNIIELKGNDRRR